MLAAQFSALKPTPAETKVGLRGAGRFVLWCAKMPLDVKLDGEPLEFAYSPQTHLLEVNLDVLQGGMLLCRWEQG